jgi:hypothetical protein
MGAELASPFDRAPNSARDELADVDVGWEGGSVKMAATGGG